MMSLRKFPVFSSCYLALGAAAVVLFSGCGNEAGFYDVSGTVQLNGEDVRLGRIIFSPDSKKDNSGPQGLANVSEGQITEVVRPIVGGPHWMEIQVYDGVAFEDVEGTVTTGKRIIPPQTLQVELPRSDVELTIDIQGKDGEEIEVNVQVQ
jgi:hypothetical protein